MLVTTSLEIAMKARIKVGNKPYYHQNPRWFRLEIHLLQGSPSVKDELSQVVDHAQVRRRVREMLELSLKPFHTLEAVALATAQFCVLNFAQVQEAEVTIFKSEPTVIATDGTSWYELKVRQRVTKDQRGGTWLTSPSVSGAMWVIAWLSSWLPTSLFKRS